MWCGGCLEAALQQSSVSQAIGIRGECAGWSAPPELVHVPEQRRVGPERREVLEQERQVAAVPEYAGWKVFDPAVLIQEPSRGDRSDARNAGIAVRRVADEGEEVGDQDGCHAELRTHSVGIADLPALAVYL